MNPSSQRIALMIIDQLSSTEFGKVLPGFGAIKNLGEVRLQYLPRTTPCGHATISLGQPPSAHRIQGREWFVRGDDGQGWIPCDINSLPISQFETSVPFNSDITGALKTGAFASRFRKDYPHSATVIVAAKAMIPFLFGAWDADVSVFPTLTIPSRRSHLQRAAAHIGRDPYEFVVRFFAGTAAGRGVLNNSNVIDAVAREMSNVASIIPGSRVEAFSDSPSVLDLHWVLPPSWDTHETRVAKKWRDDVVLAHGPRIDEFYTAIGRYLLNRLEGRPQLFVQSWFSTDFAAHRFGPSSPQYSEALTRALRQASQLANEFAVIGTSDHGGRETPHWLQCDLDRRFVLNRNENRVPLPPADHVVHCGDHITGWGGDGSAVEFFRCSWTQDRVPVPVDQDILLRSFHDMQRPQWILLPEIEERCGKGVKESTGGDHGAYSENGRLGFADDAVPVFCANSLQNLPPLPQTLDRIANWVFDFASS